MVETQQMGRTTGQPQAKRHIRNLLLDRRFQLRWVFRVAVGTTIIVAVMGFFLYQTVANATDQLLAQKLGDLNLTKEAIDAFMTQSEKDKMITLWTLIGAMFLLVLLLSGVTIALTHRVAGPIYKMRKIFGSINGSDLRLWDKLRRGDELQEAFEDFEAMLRRLREDRRNDIAALEDIRRALEKSGGNEEEVQNLRKIAERYRISVKMD